jgi:hypothetical protein
MKEFYSKKTPKSTITKLIVIELVFSFILYLIHKDLSAVTMTTWIIWLLFLIFVIYAIIKAVQNKPTLTIDNSGMTDNSSLNSSGRIEWYEIKNIEIRSGINMKFLCFDFFDENKELNKTNALKRILMKSNKKRLGTICAIPEISLNESLDSVLTEINNLRQNK